MTRPILIVGAGLGGLRTAEYLRRSGFGGQIRILGGEMHPPYNRPPLSKEVLATSVDLGAVVFDQRALTADIEWTLGSPAARADLEARAVWTAAGNRHDYEMLVIASGLRARRFGGEAAALPGTFALRTLEDAIELRAALVGSTRVVIMGSGFIGCEVAATARGLGSDVVVVSAEAVAMERPLGPELGAELQRRHEAKGVQFRMSVAVRSLVDAERFAGVELVTGEIVAGDVLVEAIGSVHNTEWLAGNDLSIEGGVLTDSGMRAVKKDGSSWSDVFVVGDAARFPNPLFDGLARSVEHWNIPTETARRTAEVIVAAQAGGGALDEVLQKPFVPVPSFWSDQYDIHLLAYGMTADADERRILHGELDGECVVGYFTDGSLSGVCGIGMRRQVIQYRSTIADRHSVAPAG